MNNNYQIIEKIIEKMIDVSPLMDKSIAVVAEASEEWLEQHSGTVGFSDVVG